jgi:hypothetical protein
MELRNKINWIQAIISEYCEHKVGPYHGYTFDIDNKRIIFIYGNMSNGPDMGITKFEDITNWVNIKYAASDKSSKNYDEFVREIWSEFIND